MYEILLIDLDDTVLDFHRTEQDALCATLTAAGITPTVEICRLFSRINDAHWKRLEKGEITRQQVLFGRFRELFDTLCVSGETKPIAVAYMENLAAGHVYLPGAEEALVQLKKKYRLYLVSNGTASVQHRRLKESGAVSYFDDVFISQEIGVNKPAKEFFDACFARIPEFVPSKTLIVGDSLSSDIRGGQNAGIATCWINPAHKECTLPSPPDYEIEALSQLPAMLENL
ncbi:MAG: YjjG family noncanonical pyrimidine nucleotidase [Oscillospiraceae bacterium]|nr:YjjG family noncanonical pyrimidine nucleotidase [Oscillospiraceae bacterium]